MNKELDLDLQLHAYVDGDLDEAAMARVEEYLRKNPEAALKIQDYLKQKDDIRGFAQREVGSDSAPDAYRLGKKLAKRLQPKAPNRGKRTLALAFLFLAGWLGHSLVQPLMDGPDFTEEVVQAHLLSSSDPGEVLPLSPERISRLFARIGELERLPDLRQFGFEPIGAQLLPSDEGMVLHVPYRNAKGTMVSYFLLHHTDAEEVDPHTVHSNGVTMIYWQHEFSQFAIAAPLPDDQVNQIVNYIEASTADL
jgi:anti-sigma factor RsiW